MIHNVCETAKAEAHFCYLKDFLVYIKPVEGI